MLEVIQLSCERDDRLLFSDLSFSLASGDILQVEGRNGAGKTTLLRILAGLASGYSGDIHWNDQPLHKVYADFRLDCYFLGHRPGLKLELTPMENLYWRLQITNNTPNESVLLASLEKVQLAGFEDIPCSHLSAGQLRRVALAGLLASKARLWILDEPFTAIDVDGVAWLEGLLYEHSAKGGMVMVTSHQPLQNINGQLRKIRLEAFSGGRHE
ncbi:hypothetical protein ACH42_14170 [Endozoicomonas sp. (ex Bugula neritina AB1)]|nr:hypothetical protein ACH42_14170 [Endozoicomonas sp. (ex Bugula neritina AB1)]